MDIDIILPNQFNRINLGGPGNYLVFRNNNYDNFGNFQLALWLNQCLNLKENQEPIKFSEFRKTIDETFDFRQYALDNNIYATVSTLWYNGMDCYFLGDRSRRKSINLLELNCSLGFLVIQANLVEKVRNIINTHLTKQEMENSYHVKDTRPPVIAWSDEDWNARKNGFF